MAIFIRLIQISEQPRTSTSSSGSEQADCSLPESTSDLRSCRILTADRLNHTLNIFRLNGIWGLANLLHSATASACTDVFDRLVTEKAWLELVRPIPLNCNLNRISSWPRTIDAQFHPIQSVCSSPHQPSKSAPPSPEDPKIKRVPSPRSSDLPSLPEPERSNALSASNEAPHLTSSSQCVPAVHEDSDCRQRHTPQRGHIEDDDDTHSIQTTMIYYTLSLLRNLLRHRRVIDAIIKNHWWNIAQLLISVLEGGYPQPVKEQAILVLAHIANGQSALEQLRLNQDMIEKLKLFMRSPDSYTKAAALIATYHVLGLGRENMDSSLLLGSRRDLGEPFFISFHHRMRHRHNCHRDRYKHRYETAHSIPGSSTTSDTHRRHLLSSVTQSLLEEAGEHEEEDYEEERTEEKHDFPIEHTSNASVSAYEPLPPDNTRSSRSQDCLVSFTEREETSVVLPNPTDSSPPLTFRDQDPSLSASPVSEAPESRHAQIEHPACIPLQRSVSHYRTLSTESSTSSDSSASCGEQLMTTSIDLADLDRTTAQDLLGSSPPTDSETELKALSPAVNEELEGISELSQCSGTRAPLAAQERMDEFESSLGSTAVCHQTHCENDPTNARINHMGSAAETSPNIYTKTSSETPSSTQVTTDTNSTHTRRSRRDWEIGFHQVLFPFLRELESDTILRSTWDWLMMRAFTRGKPIQLHDLFVAWQRLYDTIPPDSFNTADSESLCLDSSLFTDCPSIDVFLRRLRENIGISSSTTSRATTEGSHPPRRRHHHRHRHRLSAYPRHSPVPTNESNSTARDDTPLPPPLSDSEPNQGPTGLEQCPSGALS
ncbi:unnamed protein product [Dicrocoelium dendriticum]|nr:unnamed protein product [Dicrocoelium dendriticum]